ncbi:MAG: sel1 repeat family protein [Gammaproteobacteria bacterium]|nr:sel1 repeat family protein [Gammaproteobacteria bacterium]
MQKALVFLILSWLSGVAGAQEASLEEMRQAAEKGNPEAQMEVGILYEFGYNMPKNTVSALMWYVRSAEQGNVLAVKRRDQLKARMTAQEIDEAQKLASAPLTTAPPTAQAPMPAPAVTPPEEKPVTP